MITEPKKVIVNKHGSSRLGYLTASDVKEIPFPIRRVFWTYFTPESVIRGHHAHKKTTVIIFALTGKIVITTQTPKGEKRTFILNKPNVGLIVPPMIWHTQRYSHTAIQMVLASHKFNEKEYIRDYALFRSYAGKK